MKKKINNLEAHVQELKSDIGEKESRIAELENALERRDGENREEIMRDEEIKRREAVIKDKKREIDKMQSEIRKQSLREKQYRKALGKIKKEDYKVVSIVGEGLEEIPGKALTRDNQVKEKLENRGVNIHLVEDVESFELGEYAVV